MRHGASAKAETRKPARSFSGLLSWEAGGLSLAGIVLAVQIASWTRNGTANALPAVPAAASERAPEPASAEPRPAVDVQSPARVAVFLKGTVASSEEGRASAIFDLGLGADVSIGVGAKLQPSMILAEVHPGYVVLADPAGKSRIELRIASTTTTPADNSPAPPQASNLGYGRNATQVGEHSNPALEAIAALDVLRATVQAIPPKTDLPAPAGGLLLSGGAAEFLPKELGLGPGDRVVRVDGEAVTSEAHLEQLLGAASEGLARIEIRRAASGQAQSLSTYR